MKKIDFSRVKQYLLAKGERVGFGVCLGVSVVLLAVGLSTGFGGSAGNWAGKITEATNSLDKRIQDSRPPSEVVSVKIPILDWNDYKPLQIAWAPLFGIPDTKDNKRRNPPVLPILSRPNDIQMNFMRLAPLTYTIDKERQKYKAFKEKNAAEFRPSIDMRPRRVILVHMVFPLKEQLEAIRAALQLATVDEVLAEGHPRFLGLNVKRQEILADGSPAGDWESLYQFDPKTLKGDEPLDWALRRHIKVHDAIDSLMRESLLDQEMLQIYGEDTLRRGLATPLPRLAFGRWPILDLNGIKALGADDPDNKVKVGGQKPFQPGGGGRPEPPKIKFPGKPLENPMGVANPGNDVVEVDFRNRDWKELAKNDEELVKKFEREFYIFDPRGLFPGEMGMDPKGPVQPPMQPKLLKGPMGEPLAPEQEISNCVARFIDVDVQVGKTYRYAVQVRMENPNFGKKNEVLHEELAKIKELIPSAWTVTPQISIPQEFFLYATDAMVESKVDFGSDIKEAASAVKAPVQLHLWFNNAEDRPIGDWAIAERLLVRRGEYIGRPTFYLEIPEWSEMKGRFELVNAPPPGKKQPKTDKATGIPLNFQKSLPAPMLVDFVEGYKKISPIPAGKTTIQIQEEAAQDMMVLMPDGKLEIRNSREDTNAEDRTRRFEDWLYRVRELRGGGPGGNNMPGVPPKKGGGR